VSGLRTSELAISRFCRMGIGVWSFGIAFPLFCDQKGAYGYVRGRTCVAS